MRKVCSVLIVLSMLVSQSLLIASAEPIEFKWTGVVEAVMSAPDMFYVPSYDISDYSVTAYGCGAYEVRCGTEVVGWLWCAPDGGISYQTVNKQSPYTLYQNIYETQILNIPALKQPDETACWATCCAMVVRYHTDEEPTPEYIKALRPKAVEGGTWSDMRYVYNERYKLHVAEVGRTLMFSEVWFTLKNKRPIHIGGTVSGSAHSMLIVGVATGEENNVVLFNDPFYGERFAYQVPTEGDWSADVGRKYITYSVKIDPEDPQSSMVYRNFYWERCRWNTV